MRRTKQFWRRSRLHPFRLTVLFLSAQISFACTESPIGIFRGSEVSGTGGCSTPGCGSATGGVASGGLPLSGGGSGLFTGIGGLIELGGSAGDGTPPQPEPTGGSGMGGAPLVIGENCESPKPRPTVAILERLQMGVSGLCVGVGEWAPLPIDQTKWAPSYLIDLVDCEESLSQSWYPQYLDDANGQGAGYEFRNEDKNMNLDVRFAAPTEGTPLVLFPPYQLYNQRFQKTEGQNGTFKLSPLHAPNMCVTEVDGSLELAPCEDGFNDQSFRLIGCRSATL